jgi:hypothetical protein
LNRLDYDEKIIHSLRSVYYLQLALTNYSKSYLTLLKAEFIIVDYQTIEDSVNRIRKNVNQLQSLIDEKIEVYSKKYSEAEIKNIVKKYQASNEKNVTQCVNDLDHLSNNEEGFQSNKEIENMEEYDWLNREKEKINYEFNQFFFETPKI